MTEENNTLDFLNEVFEGNIEHADEIAEELEQNHMDGQDPQTTTVVCSDSRVRQQDMWKNEVLGREFTKGVIGNHVNVYTSEGDEVISGSIDYIPEHSDTETVVAVIGHTGCGAVTATYQTLKAIDEGVGLDQVEEMPESELAQYNDERLGINSDLKLIMDSGLVEDYREVSSLEDEEAINQLVERNVDNQIDFLINESEYTDTVFVGLVYDMEGFYDGNHGQLYLTNFGGSKDIEALEKEFEGYQNVEVKRVS